MEIIRNCACHCKNKTYKKKIWEKFIVIPDHIIFKDFKEGSTYTQKVKIINNDILTHQVKIGLSSLPKEINVKTIGDQRLISGLQIILEIKFSPKINFKKSQTDQRFEISIITSKDNIISLPILISSIFPKINFPSEINFPETCVNTKTYFSLFVFNLAETSEIFDISQNTLRGTLSISPDPKNFEMKPGQVETFIFQYIPTVCGNIRETISLKFTNGKSKFLYLNCNSVKCEIYLDVNDIAFGKTYIGLSSQKTFNIVNKSCSTLQFQWTKYASEEEDDLFREKLEDSHSNYLIYENLRWNHLQYLGVIKNHIAHEKIVARHFTITKNEIKNLNFPFQSSIFQIVPKSGEIYPNSSILTTVFFKVPKIMSDSTILPIEFKNQAFLKISTDINLRPKLSLFGIGIGVKMKLNLNRLDVGDIFLGEKHSYEIVCTNSDIVNGAIRFDGADCSFGGIVNVLPQCLCLNSYELGVFVLQYYPQKLGQFLEQIYFKVEYGERIQIIISGTVKPLFVYVKPEIVDFGSVPICIPQMRCIKITNPVGETLKFQVNIKHKGTDNPLEFPEFQIKTQHENNDVKNKEDSDVWSYVSDIGDCDDILYKKTIDISQRSSFINISRYSECDSELYSQSDENKNTILINEELNWVFDKMDYTLKRNDEIKKCINLLESKVDNRIDGIEITEKIVTEIFTSTFNQIIEEILNNFKNFKEKDWLLPKDPIEYNYKSLNNVLPSKESCILMVKLTPNWARTSFNTMEIILSFANHEQITNDSADQSIVNIPLRHICIIPDFTVLENEYNSQTFVELETEFQIIFLNNEQVQGFCYIEDFLSELVKIHFQPNKMFIDSKSTSKCTVKITPLTTGLITSNILLHSLGSKKKLPITIKCSSIPVQVKINPLKIDENNAKVLRKYVSRIFITNTSPTRAKFKAYLKFDSGNLHINPSGGILAPGQKCVLLLFSYFYDADCYKNFIIIDIIHGSCFKIPTKFIVTGIPLEFEPNINPIIDFGTVIASKSPLKYKFKVKNFGKRQYTLFFTPKVFIKPTKNKDQVTSSIKIEPSPKAIPSFQEVTIELSMIQSMAISVNDEIIVEINVNDKSNTKTLYFTTTILAIVVSPCLLWSQDKVLFDVAYGDDYEKKCCEKLTVENCGILPVDISCKIEGYFYFKILKEYKREIFFHLEPSKIKNMIVIFNSKLINKLSVSSKIEGKIKTKTNDQVQTGVQLIMSITFPFIEVSEKILNIFGHSVVVFKITNTGNLAAFYKWRYKSFKIFPMENNNQNRIQIGKNLSEEFLKRKSAKYKSIDEEFDIEDKNIELSDYDSEEDKDVEILIDTSKKKQKDKHLKATNKTKPKSVKKGDKSVKGNTGKSKSKLKETTSIMTSRTIKYPNYPITDVFISSDEINNILYKLIYDEEAILTIPIITNEVNLFPTNLFQEKPEDCIKLDEYFGGLDSFNSKFLSLEFLPYLKNTHYHVILELVVMGGNTCEIEFNGINCEPKISISKQIFEVGVQAWYEIFAREICVTNICEIPLHILMVFDEFSLKEEIFKNGFIKTNPLYEFSLRKKSSSQKIELISYLGLSGIVNQQIGIEVNGKIPFEIKIIGKTQIPTVTILDVPRPGILNFKRQSEYFYIQKMFNEEIDLIEIPEHEIDQDQLVVMKLRYLNEIKKTSPGDSSPRSKKSKKKEKLTKRESHFDRGDIGNDSNLQINVENLNEWEELCYDNGSEVTLKIKSNKNPPGFMLQLADPDLEEFAVLDYPNVYPGCLAISLFIEQQFMVNDLTNELTEKDSQFKNIFQNYIYQKIRKNNVRSLTRYVPPLKCTNFPIESLPIILSEYEVNFGQINMSETFEKLLVILYHGPGKLNAAIRTTAKIPGLKIDFIDPSQNCENHDDISNLKFSVFSYYPEFDSNTKIYKNKYERMNDQSLESIIDISDRCSPIKHAHSFDFNSQFIHTRNNELTALHKKSINDYYTHLSTKNKETMKDPNTLCEIFQENSKNSNGMKINVRITLTPTKNFYDDETNFDETFYIDIHLGPKIPIIFKGFILKNVEKNLE